MKRLLPFIVTFFSVIESNALEISVLTCSPGTELYSAFGHTAIRVQSPETGHDWVYNYGTFNFNTDGFYIKFARGQLDYMLSRQPFPSFQYEYLMENRSIVEQKLLLSETSLQRLSALLEENYRPENRFYKYDFFFDNCSSRVWDIINRACDGALIVPDQPDTLSTFRETVEHDLRFMPWAKIGISLALGAPYDRKMKPGEEVFLPDFLMKRLAATELNGQLIAGEATELLNQEEMEQRASSTSILLMLILLFGFSWMYVRKKHTMMRWAGGLLSWVVAVIGLLLLLLWFATDHLATKVNPDLLWAFPFPVFLLFKGRIRSFVLWAAVLGCVLGLSYYTLWTPAVMGIKLFFIPLIVSLLIYYFYLAVQNGATKVKGVGQTVNP